MGSVTVQLLREGVLREGVLRERGGVGECYGKESVKKERMLHLQRQAIHYLVRPTETDPVHLVSLILHTLVKHSDYTEPGEENWLCSKITGIRDIGKSNRETTGKSGNHSPTITTLSST